MAVPKYKRGENSLTILTIAERIVNEAIRLSKDNKTFPQRYLNILTSTFLQNAKEVAYNISAANDLKLDDKDEIAMRQQLQMQAKIQLSRLHEDIKFQLQFIDNLKVEKFNNLITMIFEAKSLLAKWKVSDSKRIAEFFSSRNAI